MNLREIGLRPLLTKQAARRRAGQRGRCRPGAVCVGAGARTQVEPAALDAPALPSRRDGVADARRCSEAAGRPACLRRPPHGG